METIARSIRRNGMFLRRRDLRARGYGDEALRAALAERTIFRVRQGWYSVPDAPEPAIRAVRVGGRLTGVSALETYGVMVPRRDAVHVAVPRNACRLRRPGDRRKRLAQNDGIRVHWTDQPRDDHGNRWRVSMADALLSVLTHESRDVAVACASAVMHHVRWPEARLDAVFRRAPLRVRKWRMLVSGLDESHGETFARLWLGDAGIPWESQPRVQGIGRLDGRVSPHRYVEIDGSQHDPNWTGEGPSTYNKDRDRDVKMAIAGDTVHRWTYLQLYRDWALCLASIQRGIADDLELAARRERHPALPRSLAATRKRRRSAAKARSTDHSEYF